jgi:hypothetical protein
VNISQGSNQGLPHSCKAMHHWGLVSDREPAIDPGNEIAGRKIANEQKQRIGELVEAAVAEGRLGSGQVSICSGSAQVRDPL